MESTNMNIRELYSIQQKKIQSKQKVFDNILKRIHHQIKTVSYRGQTNLVYSVPQFLIGIPTYDASDCMTYLLQRLQKEGFELRYLPPNNIYIDWKIDVSFQQQQQQQQLACAENADNNQQQQNIASKLKYNPTGKLFN